MLTKTSIC